MHHCQSELVTLTTSGLGVSLHLDRVHYLCGDVVVVGCADLELSNGAVIQRKGADELIVRCPGSRETWYMTCGSDNRWIGELFNCSSSTCQ